MLLVVRDEADILDAQIAFHLNAGVDFVLATHHEPGDGTTEILDGTYERVRATHPGDRRSAGRCLAGGHGTTRGGRA